MNTQILKQEKFLNKYVTICLFTFSVSVVLAICIEKYNCIRNEVFTQKKLNSELQTDLENSIL